MPNPGESGNEGDGLPPGIVISGSSGQTASEQQSSPRETGGANAQVPADPTELSPALPQDTSIDQAPPPAYSDIYGQVDINQDGFDTRAKVANDGRVNIRINQSSRRLSDLLVPALRSQLNIQHAGEAPAQSKPATQPIIDILSDQLPPPSLNVVIHVVGSRGDVQPFVALGKTLRALHGHRVRLATHPTFRGFVEENGLEFFSIGGDPAELMAFMVKNPGLMPGMDSLRSGDVGKRRKGMYEIVQGCWRSCIEIGDGTGTRASDDPQSRASLDSGIAMDGDISSKPFIADAIIANPPSFAHIHCAEKLGIPLHLMFTMPWSPTQAFPHPLANIQSSNADANMSNFVSYALVEMMTWQGLGDVINRFREKSLGLEPVSLMWAPGMASRLRIPYTYCWSPALIPKPKDWGPHISISGFYFLSLADKFKPEPELAAFLEDGPPPVYIGFGSIVVDDPNAMTRLIFDAIRITGQRALVSKGWGGFGADELGIPDGVFMLGNVPHDWLFKHVSCVVHHGGAGTTAAGIALGKPTVIVPFFGDQPFWGAMVAKAGAGPTPVPHKQLTATNLAAAIEAALKPSARERAQELGARIRSEKGTTVGAKSFQSNLDIDALRCSVAPSRAAVWRVKRTKIRLSAFAATALGNEGLLDFHDLKLYRPKEYDSEDGPWDPITGGASALLGTIGSMMMGVADFPVEILRALRFKSSDQASSGHHEQPSPTVIPPPTDSDSLRPSFTASFRDAAKLMSPASSTVSLATQDSSTTEASEATDVRSPSQEQDAATSREGRVTSPVAMPEHRSFLAKSLKRASSRSRSPRRSSGPDTLDHLGRSLSGSQAGRISLDAAVGAGKGVGRIVGAGLKSPMDFTLSIARGFHNAPKLYGDESVRQPDKVTDLQSGLKAAGKEFGFGLYDGISGLVTQPLEGVKKDGVVGLVKGFGKGIGGVVLKPGAAIWGLPGYTFKGIYKELQKHFGSSVQNYIIAGRTAQGFEDLKHSTHAERMDVVLKWRTIQLELGKEKHQVKNCPVPPPCRFLKTRHMSFDERKHLAKNKIQHKNNAKPQIAKNRGAGPISMDLPLQHSLTFPQPAPTSSVHNEFEEAIQRSVEATSKGNPEEDAVIEKAIRASVLELQQASDEGDNEEMFQRAIQASIAEARRAKGQNQHHSQQLEAALIQSIQQSLSVRQESSHMKDLDFDDSGIDTDEDENIKTAIESSKKLSIADDRDEILKQALEESKRFHDEHEQALKKVKTEEEIVMEYIKRQSLAEDAYKDSSIPSKSEH